MMNYHYQLIVFVAIMDDIFKIFVEQLRDGQEKLISEVLPPDFLDISEPNLGFHFPVKVNGVVYIAEHELLMCWSIQTQATIPCNICNEAVNVPVEIENIYASEPLTNIKSGIYNFKELLRETILLEIPHFVECNSGNCPQRTAYAKYFQNTENSSEDLGEEKILPFADLKWDLQSEQEH